ncbi:MAG: Glutamine--fructose-6-phosphate aminotransferase [isomerizing] [Fimbriimonadaceae bacterium]|nr:Glutamine--fructose-6-phosphate aminotransferase [isomerizing] [Fimbriimonadaceae bacterium]
MSVMATEIESQPRLLAEHSSRYAMDLGVLAGRPYDVVLLAARGSSDHAALYARYLIEIHLGLPAILAAPSVITRFKAKVRYPKALAIGISQSGAAPDVSEVIERMREDGHDTLAITNTAGSRLAAAAGHVLLLDVGQEQAVAATKTYTASLLALYRLVQALGADLPDPKLPTEEDASTARSLARQIVGEVVRSRIVFAVARGYGFATAVETALKLIECALVPCKGYSTADFQHGPAALAAPDAFVLGYGELPTVAREARHTIYGGDTGPSGPISDILFGQWLAYECAMAKGLDPDQPRNLEKVTETR